MLEGFDIIAHVCRMDSHDAILDRLGRAIAANCGQNSSDFDLNKDLGAGFFGRKLTPAAVLVGLVRRGASTNVILTQRTRALKHHPGQIAFPGGKKDADDPDLIATALREAEEEIGLRNGHVSIIGSMPRHETVTGFEVEPIIAHIDPAFSPLPEAGEVEQVFEVPFPFLMHPESLRVESRDWRGVKREYYTIPYGPHYIWGATARMIVSLRDAWDQAL